MDINKLEKIQKVAVPDFLFTRIEQRIKEQNAEGMPKNSILALTFSFGLLLLLNAMVLVKVESKPNAIQSYAESIHIVSNNSLY